MFPKLPKDLSALSDEELAQLHDQLVAAFNEAAEDEESLSDELVAALSGVADDVETIRGEQTSRATAAAARQEQLHGLASRIKGEDETQADEGADDGDEDSDEGDEGDAGGQSEDGDEQAPAEVTQPESPAEGEGETQAIAATGKTIKAGQGATLATLRASAPVRTRPRSESAGSGLLGNVSIVASADVPGITAGAPVTSTRQIAELMIDRQRTLGRGNEDNVPVVSFSLEMPQDRHLSSHLSSEELLNRLSSFDTTPTSITAAGGLCAPVNNYYAQMVIAGAERPVRDALANFTADRGGIRYVPPPKLSSITSGVGTVTAAQDLAGGSPATKSCFTVTCNTITEVDITAVYNCLTFGNFGARAFPEQVEAWVQLALALQARTAEQLLLDGIAAASTSVTTAGLVGAGREVLARLGQAAAGYRSRNRMAHDAPLRVLLPGWVLSMVKADLVRSFTDEPGLIDLTDQIVEGWFADRHLNVTWYLDSKTGGAQVFGAAAGGQTYVDGTTTGTTNWSSATAGFTSADVGKTITGTNIPAGTTIASVTNGTTIVLSQNVTGTTGSGSLSFTVGRSTLAQFPTTVYSYLFAEGSFLHLDGGTLDLGLVRDSTLNSTNQFRMFTENFENVALVGPESLEVVMTLNPDGSYGAAKSITLPINS